MNDKELSKDITQLVSREQIQAIQELTQEQQAALEPIRDKWTAIGLNCEPADRAAAQKAADDAYRVMREDALSSMKAKLIELQLAESEAAKRRLQREVDEFKQLAHDLRGVPDEQKYWVDSPIEAVELYNKLVNKDKLEQIEQLKAQIAGAGGEALDLLQKIGELESELSTGNEALDNVCYGQHDANWLAFYEALSTLGVDTGSLDPINRIAQSCHWWWPLDEAIIFCERMKCIHRDENGELHCEDGPALEYRDGWGVYCWHGIRVPPSYITEKDAINFKMVQDQQNAELRRCLVEIMGEEKYLEQANPTILDEDPECGTLMCAKVGEDDEDIYMVRVINSTPEPDGSKNIYYLRVPPPESGGPTTARSAVAWTFGLDAQGYRPQRET